MLKTYKNLIFEVIQLTQFSVADFDIEDSPPVFVIRYKPLQALYFRVEENPITAHSFSSKFSRFDPPKHPSSGLAGPLDITGVAQSLATWIKNQVDFAKRETEQPDLFAEFSASIAPASNETFSEQERVQIRVSIQQFKLSIIKEFGPNDNQLHRITEKLDHLSESVEKLNRFDWSGVAIQTVISIAVDLALDPPKRHILVTLFKQAFEALHLLASAL